MWIKDNHERLINSDNVVHYGIADANKDKKDKSPSWVVAARIVRTDWKLASIAWLTECFPDKDEARMRLDQIENGIKDGLKFIELE